MQHGLDIWKNVEAYYLGNFRYERKLDNFLTSFETCLLGEHVQHLDLTPVNVGEGSLKQEIIGIAYKVNLEKSGIDTREPSRRFFSNFLFNAFFVALLQIPGSL